MLSAVGRLRYEPDYRLVLEADKDFAAYYRSLFPEDLAVQVPRWPPHVTVVRAEKEAPTNLEAWGKYEGEEVEFHYDPEVRIDKVYYWLNVWCDRLVEIREELGLPPKSRWTKPPSGGFQCFHLTIGNKKNGA